MPPITIDKNSANLRGQTTVSNEHGATFLPGKISRGATSTACKFHEAARRIPPLPLDGGRERGKKGADKKRKTHDPPEPSFAHFPSLFPRRALTPLSQQRFRRLCAPRQWTGTTRPQVSILCPWQFLFFSSLGPATRSPPSAAETFSNHGLVSRETFSHCLSLPLPVSTRARGPDGQVTVIRLESPRIDRWNCIPPTLPPVPAREAATSEAIVSFSLAESRATGSSGRALFSRRRVNLAGN